MKIRLRFAAALAALMMCCFFTSVAKADVPQEEAPEFRANIEWSPQGYIVKGTFTEFPPDISRAETLYSLDAETYQDSGEEWDITNWSCGPWTDWDEADLEKFHNQTCLHSNTEPLKSYLAGKLDRFYVKLRLTRENGIIYETRGTVIERRSTMPVPDEMTPYAVFAPSICVRTFRPFSYYGRYQITVSEDAAPEEIAAFLPDTLPIRIGLQKGCTSVADCIVDCPVAWKPLPDLSLTAGESVTIPDAAEEILVPGGTMLNTPLGAFQLKESLGIDPLGINQPDRFMDEVRLVLNVVAKDSSPTGALSCDYNGLALAFHQKPTKATAIRAYALSEGDTEWTELSGVPLLDAVNAQPSTPGSGYTYVLDNTHELYQSYMAAYNEGREPSPFFIGIKIDGGVYDGKNLILPWPSTYDLPLNLPEPGGSGGNEANAGADNQGDSTPEGQRPNLPDLSGAGGNDGSGGSGGNGGSGGSDHTGSYGGSHTGGGMQKGQRPQQPASGNSAGNNGSGGSNHTGSYGGVHTSGGTETGQRPKLMQDTGVNGAALSGENSGQGNPQAPSDTHMAAASGAYAQNPQGAQAAAGTAAKTAFSDAGSSENNETDAPAESLTLTPTPRPAQDNESSARTLSVKEKNSGSSAENSSGKFLVLIFASITGASCTAGISVAAIAGRPGRFRKFKKTQEYNRNR